MLLASSPWLDFRQQCRKRLFVTTITQQNVTAARACFEANFTMRGELGASASIWQEGREILNLADGWRDRQHSSAWEHDTLVLLWSITKGLAAACLLHVLDKHGIPLEKRVAAIWPEFGQSGKTEITLAQLLSHQAGLAALENMNVSILDHAAVAAALAEQAPAWMPGSGHGYHARTYGFLLDEVLRRLHPGATLGQYWRDAFGEPLGLDVWIGLPDAEAGRVASVFPARSTGNRPLGDFYDALADEASLTRRAFAAPQGLHSVASMNTPEARRASLPSLGGIGSARSLGKFYAMLANDGKMDGQAFFSPQALGWMTTTLANGPDQILRLSTAYSAGFMQDPLGMDGRKLRETFGPSTAAFGQPGAGGGHAFADPQNGIAFAYVMNQMELGVMPNDKSLSIVAALYNQK